MSSGRPIGHWLLLLAIVIFWGSAFGVNEIAIRDFTPLVLVSGRLILAALILTALLSFRGVSLPRSVRFWLFSLAMAIIGNALPFWLITHAQLTIDSGLTGILMAVMPLSTLLLAHIFLPDEKLSGRKMIGFLLGLIGIVVLIGPEALLELEGQGTAFWAQAAALLAALCYAANAIIARRRPAFDPITAAAGTMIVGALIMAPLGGRDLPAEVMQASLTGLAAGAALTIMASVIAPIMFFKLIAVAGPGFTAFMNYLIPLWAILLGFVVLGEEPRWSALLALCLILCGLAISEWTRPLKAKYDTKQATGQ